MRLIDTFKDLLDIGYSYYRLSGGATDCDAYGLEYFDEEGYLNTFFFRLEGENPIIAYENSSKMPDGPFLLKEKISQEKHAKIISAFEMIYKNKLNEFGYCYTDSFVGRY